MTETQDMVAWAREDQGLADRLDTELPDWADPDDGLQAKLDEDDDSSGWRTWSDDDKRAHLRTQLDKWAVAWVRDDPQLVERLDQEWPEWATGEAGLAQTLDEDENWSGWRTWTDDEKRSYLAETLDTWYPPSAEDPAGEGAEAEAPGRLAWVQADDALVTRLDDVWAGWEDSGPDGLAAYLDAQEDWSGWETWSDDDKRSYLAESLDTWYPAEEAATESAPDGEASEPTAEEKKAAEELIAAGLEPEQVEEVGNLVEEVHTAALDELHRGIPELASRLGVSEEELVQAIGDIPAEEFSRVLADRMTSVS